MSGSEDDLIHRYVRFHFAEYEIDPYGWVTKDPYSVAEFANVVGLGDICSCCNEPRRWIDMFDIAWCRSMFWGDDPLLAPGWEPCEHGERCTVVTDLNSWRASDGEYEAVCAEPAIAFSPVLGFPMCRSHYKLFQKRD